MSKYFSKFAIAICILATLMAFMTVGASAEETDGRYEQFFTAIEDGIKLGKTEIDVESIGIYADELQLFYFAFIAESPEYSFCLERSVEYFAYPSTGLIDKIKIAYDDVTTVANRQNWINSEIDKIAAQIDADWPDAYKAIWISNYICDNYSYELGDTEYRDVYNFLLHKKGVCEAYTALFTLVAREVGLDASFCQSETLNHIWNVVEVDGEWYHVDVTWNDLYSCRYGYLLLSDDANYEYRANEYGDFDTFSLYAATSNTYDNAFWRDGYYSAIEETAYGFYCIESGNLYQVDFSTVAATLKSNVGSYLWKVPGYEMQYYADTFHDVIGKKTLLIYNTPTAVYALDLSDGTKTEIYKSEHEFEIFGLVRSGDDLIVVHYDPTTETEYTVSVPNALAEQKVYCTVQFKSGDKIVYEISVEKGTAIPYPDIAPEIASDAYYDYFFLGWKNFEDGMIATDPAIVIEAEFESVLRSYTVKFLDKNSMVEFEMVVEAGTTYGSLDLPIGMNLDDASDYYLFSEWVGLLDNEKIISDVTLTATYTTVHKHDITDEYASSLLEFYDLLEESMRTGAETINVQRFGFCEADIFTVIDLYEHNRPETSFMFGELLDYAIADSIDLVTSITVSYSGNTDFATKTTWLDAKLDALMAEIDVDWSDLQKVLYVNDYLCDNFKYSATAEGVGLYAFIADGQGGTREYSDLFTALMQRLGIKVSHAYNQTRLWNYVELNGQWYNVDVAANDSYAGHYVYFLLSDSKLISLGKTYATITSSYVANSEKYDYAFWRDGLYCSVVPVGNDAYTIIDGKIYKVNLSDLSTALVKSLSSYEWKNDATGKVQTKTYFDMIAVGDMLIYSTPTKVFAYSLTTKNHEVLYSSTKSTHIYSIHLQGDLLVCGHCTDTANDTGFINTVALNDIFKVTYYLDDGSVYATQTYLSGEKLEYPASPIKDGFTFTGWSISSGTVISANMDVVAGFETTRDLCTVIFMSDGEVYERVVVDVGTVITLPVKNPTKASDTYNDYLFVSWEGYTDGMVASGANVILVAKYKPTIRKYTVKFYDGNTLISSATYDAGTAFKKVAKPSMQDRTTGGIRYSFKGWGAIPETVLSDIELTAVFEAETKYYTVSYYNGDVLVYSEDVTEGTMLKFASGLTVTKPETETHRYYFDKWVGHAENTPVTSDVKLTATFIEVAINPEPQIPDEPEPTPPEPTTPDPSEKDNDHMFVYLIVAIVALVVVMLVVAVISKIRRRY